MVKHTQTIHRLLPTTCLSMFDHFMGLVLKGLNNLCKRNEITEAEKKQMRPMSAQLGDAHVLLKIHTVFANIPKFRPIIDTTSTPYYKIGQYLPSLLQPITIK